MITCTRRIQFCAGHRVLNHEGKCRNLHGHNYVVLITAEADGLDFIGRVIDFSVLKQKVGGWIEQKWDHGFIVFSEDNEAKKALSVCNEQKTFEMPANPTAENMAKYLLNTVCPAVLKGTGVRVVKVVCWETENCHAEAIHGQ